MNGTIYREENKVIVSGDLVDFHKILSSLHVVVEKLGYQSVVIDTSSCTSAFQNTMLSVCAQGCLRVSAVQGPISV